MINVMELAELDIRLHKASYREFAGPCPNPDCSCRTDGFRVQPDKNVDRDGTPKGGFMCRGCWDPRCPPIRSDLPRWGDAIDYLRHVKKMSYAQAQAYLIGQESWNKPVKHEKRDQPEILNYQSEKWQKAAHQMVQNCIARLWSTADTLALDYSYSRGFSDELILKARLGYSVKGGVPRLVVPSLNSGIYVAISYRDLRPDAPQDKRWQDISGGTKSQFYLADCLERERPTVVLEAPLDALSVVQTCADLVNVVATGGTNSAKNRKNLMQLALQDLVFFAFDADEAGDKEAQWWLDRLPNAKRLRPQLHDVNNMLVQGWDIRQWITDVLQAAGYSIELSCPPAQAVEDVIPDEEATISNEQEHSEPLVASCPPTQAVEDVIPDEEATISNEQEHLESLVASFLDHEHFMSYVNCIADALPVPCTITPQPVGYTIVDRAKEVALEEAERVEAMLMRNAIHNAHRRAIYLLRGVEHLTYPLNYPDPNGAFYGYDTIRESSWYPFGFRRGLRELVNGVSLIAKALIHLHMQRFIPVKEIGLILYPEYINDQWAEYLNMVYTHVDLHWRYVLPRRQENRALLRSLCEQTLAFENHFLVCYRSYLLSLLRSKDQDSQSFAIDRLDEVHYPDEEVRVALLTACEELHR